MKVLAISHSCVVDVNQELFVAMRRRERVQLELIVPAKWTSDYAERLHPPRLLESVDFPVHALPVCVPGHVSLHFYRTMPLSRLRRFGPDVLLSAQEPWSLSGLQAAWLARQLDCPFVFQTNQNIVKRYPPPFAWIERISYRTASLALAYSEEARQVLLRKGLRGPSAVAPYSVDLRLFAPGSEPELREQLGLTNAVVIGYMGRLVPEKGLDALVEAAAMLRRRQGIPRFALLFIGSGRDESRLKGLVEQEGLGPFCCFRPPVPYLEAARYMRCMDLFVLPSRTTPGWKEQFGRVVIEALASGVPVVGSDSGEIPHLLARTQGGLVFREGDATDLAEKLERLLCDPRARQRLGHTGEAAVRRQYAVDAVAQQMVSLLRTVQRGGD